MPPKVTLLSKACVLKFAPAIVTVDPTAAVVGVTLAMLGAGVTVNGTPVLLTPPAAVTITLLVTAVGGTVTVMLLLVQPTMEAGTPPTVTALSEACVLKFAPAIVTVDPPAPVLGVKLVMLGGGVTVNSTPGLDTPPAAVTTILPVTAVSGTATGIVLLVHPVITAGAAPNITLLSGAWALKLAPAMVTVEPTAPVFGAKLAMLGAGVTVNGTPGLDTPPAAVTTTLPVVVGGTVTVMLLVVQPVTVAGTPPNVTVLSEPCALKLAPAMVIEDPLAPVLGIKLVMLGAGVTVNCTPALATPPAAVTTTLPVAAVGGTVTVMLLVVHEMIEP